MDKIVLNNGKIIDKQTAVNIFEKMISDQRKISEYIKKNHTLNGYPDKSVQFAKPI